MLPPDLVQRANERFDAIKAKLVEGLAPIELALNEKQIAVLRERTTQALVDHADYIMRTLCELLTCERNVADASGNLPPVAE